MDRAGKPAGKPAGKKKQPLRSQPGKVDKQLARLKAARAKKTQVPVSSKDSADLNSQNNNSLFVPKRSLLPIPIYSAKV